MVTLPKGYVDCIGICSFSNLINTLEGMEDLQLRGESALA